MKHHTHYLIYPPGRDHTDKTYRSGLKARRAALKYGPGTEIYRESAWWEKRAGARLGVSSFDLRWVLK